MILHCISLCTCRDRELVYNSLGAKLSILHPTVFPIHLTAAQTSSHSFNSSELLASHSFLHYHYILSIEIIQFPSITFVHFFFFDKPPNVKMHFTKSTTFALMQSASVFAATKQVMVGPNGGLTFSPTSVTAAVGDTVQFMFVSQNHTVTSGNPNAGCTPNGVFNSGFVPAPGGAAAVRSFSSTFCPIIY